MLVSECVWLVKWSKFGIAVEMTAVCGKLLLTLCVPNKHQKYYPKLKQCKLHPSQQCLPSQYLIYAHSH